MNTKKYEEMDAKRHYRFTPNTTQWVLHIFSNKCDTSKCNNFQLEGDICTYAEAQQTFHYCTRYLSMIYFNFQECKTLNWGNFECLQFSDLCNNFRYFSNSAPISAIFDFIFVIYGTLSCSNFHNLHLLIIFIEWLNKNIKILYG